MLNNTSPVNGVKPPDHKLLLIWRSSHNNVGYIVLYEIYFILCYCHCREYITVTVNGKNRMAEEEMERIE